MLEKMEKVMEVESEEAKTREEMEKQKRKEETRKLFELQRGKRKEELRVLEEHKRKAQVLPQDEYLYKRLENRYKREVLMPMLEETKEKLAEKRRMLKPITRQEIELHAKKVEQIISEKDEERRRELRKRHRVEHEIAHNQRQMASLISRDVIMKDAAEREVAKHHKQQKKEAREKMIQYADLVKQIRPTNPSEKKAAELKKLIEGLKHPVRQRRDVKADYEISKVLPRRSQSRGMHADPQNPASRDKSTDDAKHTPKPSTRRSCEPRKYPNGQTGVLSIRERRLPFPQQSEAKIRKVPDYLAEIRKKRDVSDAGSVTKSVRYDWQSDIDNESLNTVERINRVVEKAGMLEKEARMKEKMLRVCGGKGSNNLNMSEDVSDMLIDSIKAKLAVLDQL